MSRNEVRVGQVYRTVGAAGGRAWRVTATVSLLGIPHARVVNTEDHGHTKTLSCFVLADRDYYLPTAAPAA